MYLLALSAVAAAGPAPIDTIPWYDAPRTTFADLVDATPGASSAGEPQSFVWAAVVREGGVAWVDALSQDRQRARSWLTDQGLVSARRDEEGNPLPPDGTEPLVLPAVLTAGEQFAIGTFACAVGPSPAGADLLTVRCLEEALGYEVVDTYHPTEGLVGRFESAPTPDGTRATRLTEVERVGGAWLFRWKGQDLERIAVGPLRPDAAYVGTWTEGTAGNQLSLQLDADGRFTLMAAGIHGAAFASGSWGVRDGRVVVHPTLQDRPLATLGATRSSPGPDTVFDLHVPDPLGFFPDRTVTGNYTDGHVETRPAPPYRFPARGAPLVRVEVKLAEAAVHLPVPPRSLGERVEVEVDIAAITPFHPIGRLILRPDGDQLVGEGRDALALRRAP